MHDQRPNVCHAPSIATQLVCLASKAAHANLARANAPRWNSRAGPPSTQQPDGDFTPGRTDFVRRRIYRGSMRQIALSQKATVRGSGERKCGRTMRCLAGQSTLMRRRLIAGPFFARLVSTRETRSVMVLALRISENGETLLPTAVFLDDAANVSLKLDTDLVPPPGKKSRKGPDVLSRSDEGSHEKDGSR